jgi:quercetin dioxygenase-like cupin family protein
MMIASPAPRRLLVQLSRLMPFLILVLIAGASTGEEIGVMQFPDGEVQHVVRFANTPWGPCPPTLPNGCEMAVLDGDPQSEDLFTVRFRIADGLVMPPHWHPKDERVTIISGTAAVAFGADTDRRDATEFGPGDYYVNARDAVHQVWIDGDTILQITGIGPWKVIPVKETPPASNP